MTEDPKISVKFSAAVVVLRLLDAVSDDIDKVFDRWKYTYKSTYYQVFRTRRTIENKWQSQHEKIGESSTAVNNRNIMEI